MAKRQTTQRNKTTNENDSSVMQAENPSKQGRPSRQQTEKTSPQNRKAKFYDDVLNCRLRELMDGREARTEELANAVGIGSSGVRMWYTGYARPDIEKIPIICKFYEVSADWLLGLSEAQSIDMGSRQISEETGLTDHALLNMKRLAEQANDGESPYPKLSAQEQLWLINHFIEDIDTVYAIADKTNAYVNIRNAVDNFEIAEYDGTSATDLMKQGLEKFGMTFNFTHGQETADYLSYMIQKHFLDFAEGIRMPAWVAKEHNKSREES
jgi:transcriptional regulator with XRE-family HTH domain